MTDLPARFVEDRRLRDAARAVLEEDVARIRASLDQQGVASRVSTSVGATISGRIRAGANDVLAIARQQASDHRGVLALLVGAILLWLLRGPLLDLIEAITAGDAEDAEPQPASATGAAAPSPTGDALPQANEDDAA